MSRYASHTPFLSSTICAVMLCALAISFGPLATADTKKPRLNIEGAVGVLELRIEMAENSLKLFKNNTTLTELISALEDYLNRRCFGNLHKTLSYRGGPSEPTCVRYMERLLEVNPGNPAAICLRDGITAPACISAYQNQKISVYYSGGSNDEIPSPALKSGISAAEREKLEKLTLTLKDVNSKYTATQEAPEKARLMDDALALYDQMLTIACRITALRFIPRAYSNGQGEDSEIRQVRERLLKIPPKLRPEHQERMLLEAETRFASAKGNKTEQDRLKALMDAIRAPGGAGFISVETSERERLILPKCKELSTQCLTAFPKAPSPICHQEGWFTPNCLKALRLYKVEQQQRYQAQQAGKADIPSAPPPRNTRDYSKF